MNDLTNEGVQFRLGGMKFNEGDYLIGDYLELSSMNSFANVTSFISGWVYDSYGPNGGDGEELQLDALHIAAEDMNLCSTPGNANRYIVLITDDTFHENDYDPLTGYGSQYTKAGVLGELTSPDAGCTYPFGIRGSFPTMRR